MHTTLGYWRTAKRSSEQCYPENKKAESPIHLGNPAVSKIYRMFCYRGSTDTPQKSLAMSNNSHSQVPHLGFKDPWLSAPPSWMVWLCRINPF